MAVFCLEENRAQKDFSATTWVAAALTFALGVYSVMATLMRRQRWESARP
jgi:uncharacterized membrane protein (DUF4010 family)